MRWLDLSTESPGHIAETSRNIEADLSGSRKSAVIIYGRVSHIALGTVITEAKAFVNRVFVLSDRQDQRINALASSLGAIVVYTDLLEYLSSGIFTGVDVIVAMYGDGTHDPARIPKLENLILNGQDIVVAPAQAELKVNDAVLALNNKNTIAISSGFIACAQSCLKDLKFKNGMDLSAEILASAKSRKLNVRHLEKDDSNSALERCRIGVVVPAYNEERLVSESVRSIPPYVKRIYVVDDGSQDRTLEVLKSIDDPRLDVTRHQVNKGVGAAIVTGYRRALDDGMDIIAVMAGDNQMDPVQLPRLLAPIIDGRADYTKGNRLLSKNLRKGMSPWRSFGNFLLTMITKIGSGYWHVSDPQNGYTAITREALSSLDLDSVYTYYGYCNDLLIKLNAFGMRTEDVVMPARYGSEKSKIRYGRYMRKVAPMIFRGFLWRLKTKYVVLDFHPLVLFYAAGALLTPAGLLCCALAPVAFVLNAGYALTWLTLAVQLTLSGVLALLAAMFMDRQETGRINRRDRSNV